MKRLILILLVACPLIAKGPTLRGNYRFDTIDLPFFSLNGIGKKGMLSAHHQTPGAYDGRLDRSLTLTPVTCDNFTRATNTDRPGPSVVGMNSDGTVVGSDAGTSSVGISTFAMIQPLNGACTFFMVPGSWGTDATDISDTGDVIGYYWNSPFLASEPGLLRIHGYLRDSFGPLRLDGPGSRDVVLPTGINSTRQMVGFLLADIGTDNSYVYHAFFYDKGKYQITDYPGGQDVQFLSLNNVGQAIGITGNSGGIGFPGVVGGVAFLFENGEFFPLPTPTDATRFMVPMAIADNGVIVGAYQEFFPPVGPISPSNPGRYETHQFMATPVTGGRQDKGIRPTTNTKRTVPLS